LEVVGYVAFSFNTIAALICAQSLEVVGYVAFSFNTIAALICAQSLEVVGYVALSVCLERCGKKLKRLADQPNFAQKAK
jgi:hypothetical protein